MILFGYLSRNSTFPGGTFEPPDAKGQTTIDASLAQEQLGCIKEFLTHVNFIYAWVLAGTASPAGRHLSQPENIREFAKAESNALRIGSFPFAGGFLAAASVHGLWIDKDKASAHHYGEKQTWIFDRLCDLNESSIPVEVWDTGWAGNPGQFGADYEGWNWTGEQPGTRIEPRAGARPTRMWTMNRNKDPSDRGGSYTIGPPRMRRGDTYVHELIVHAWRALTFGYTPTDKPENWGPKEWFLRSGHHNSPHHMGVGLKHNMADIEADLLSFYLTVNQDWASGNFKDKEHIPEEVLDKLGKGMSPPLKYMGGKWVDEDWIRKWINAERQRKGRPPLTR